MRKQKKSNIEVFICLMDTNCAECNEELMPGDIIFRNINKGNVCLRCAGFEHLIFLPPGDACVSRRARKYSTLSAVVKKLNRSQNRYETKGYLVESNGLEMAEEECLSDYEYRERRKKRDAIRREKMDQKYVQEFAGKIRELFPGCPEGKEYTIAEHACLKHSGRVGRSASAKEFSEAAIRLAVIAHIRHAKTDYDELLSKGYDREDARISVEDIVKSILSNWRNLG